MSNCTVTKVTAGSVSADNTIAFTGSDSAAASAAQTSLLASLKASDASIYGTTYGAVTVSNAASGTASNPQGELVHSLFC